MSINTVKGTMRVKIYARKFYQHTIFGSPDEIDRFKEFDEDERKALIEYIEQNKSFQDTFSTCYIFPAGDFNGKGQVLNYKCEITDDGQLYLVSEFAYDNVDHYTAKKIKSIMSDNCEHYYNSGTFDYGDMFYYKIKVDVGQKDPAADQIELCDKDTPGREVGSRYNFSASLLEKNIAIDDEGQMDATGVSKSQLRIKCDDPEHGYRFYTYSGDKVANLYGCIKKAAPMTTYELIADVLERIKNERESMHGLPRAIAKSIDSFRITDSKDVTLVECSIPAEK